MRQEVDQVLTSFGGRPRKPLLRASSLSFIRELILSGDVLAILSQLTMAGDLLRGTIRVVPVDIHTPPRLAGLITLRDRARSLGLKVLESSLREYLASARTTGLFDATPEIWGGVPARER